MRYGIEAITLPVSDVDRAKEFYERAGWHLDVDTEFAPGMRVVQFTPPGSDCSISFGTIACLLPDPRPSTLSR